MVHISRSTRALFLLVTASCGLTCLCAAQAGEITEQYGSCGENCLFEIAMLLNRDASYDAIRDEVDPHGTRETDLARMASAATHLGLAPVGLHLEQRDIGLLLALEQA